MYFARIDGKYSISAKDMGPELLINEMIRAIKMIAQDMDQTYPGDAATVIKNAIADLTYALGERK